MIAAMLEAGTPGHLIYAWQKTGLIPDEEGYKSASPEVQSEWDDALSEYESITRQQRRAWEKELRKAIGGAV